ncbi:uncharacterized protein LOC126609166 [Malus sylvestris]|uniref:uncharacterized protein LOC126609166 n=1 Tax=Malus sylvestris TaxID=3752 RepID=UPI0021AC0564|nr:uncharacterized protein LOC126609166 [Malus sylvestris]
MELLQEFVFGLWRLWKNRNDVIFNQRIYQPIEILEAWKMSLAKYRNVVEKGKQKSRPGKSTKALVEGVRKIQWQKPYFGKIKINTDVAWCKETQRAGVGWVVWDFVGVLQGVGGSGTMRFHSVAVEEAAAIQEALEFCLLWEFENVIIESNAKAIVQMIRKELSHDFRLECFLGNIGSLVRRMQSVAFVFVPRESNKAAHLVAKYHKGLGVAGSNPSDYTVYSVYCTYNKLRKGRFTGLGYLEIKKSLLMIASTCVPATATDV